MPRCSVPFSEEEDEILRELFGKAPIRSVIMFELWGRSESQIKGRAKELGLKNEMRYRNHWTTEDVEYLVDNFETAEWGDIIEKLNRPGSAIRNKASGLGLKRNEQNNQRRTPNCSRGL